MAVRGAPAIAIAGALSVAAQLTSEGQGKQFATAKAAQEAVLEQLDYLVTRFARLLYMVHLVLVLGVQHETHILVDLVVKECSILQRAVVPRPSTLRMRRTSSVQ